MQPNSSRLAQPLTRIADRLPRPLVPLGTVPPPYRPSMTPSKAPPDGPPSASRALVEGSRLSPFSPQPGNAVESRRSRSAAGSPRASARRRTTRARAARPAGPGVRVSSASVGIPARLHDAHLEGVAASGRYNMLGHAKVKALGGDRRRGRCPRSRLPPGAVSGESVPRARVRSGARSAALPDLASLVHTGKLTTVPASGRASRR